MSDQKPKDGLKTAGTQAETKPATQPAADVKSTEAQAGPATPPATASAPAPVAPATPAAPAETKPVETKATEAPPPAAAETKPVETKPAEPAAPAAETKPAAKIALVVDDEPANRDFLMRLLEQTGMEVKGASDGKEALDIASKNESLALLAIDHKLPDMDGVDLIRKLREKYPGACVVMATMLDERALMTQAFENGCNVFLVKPHGFMELFKRLQETGPDPEQFNHLIIDQYGLRPYRG